MLIAFAQAKCRKILIEPNRENRNIKTSNPDLKIFVITSGKLQRITKSIST
jgi:hypothetical protein